MLIMAALGCGQKTVTDPGPFFTLVSGDLKTTDTQDMTVNLDRDNVQEGPSFQIQTEKLDEIKTAKRTLICGDVELVGQSFSNPNSAMFNFRISEAEFAGLSTLPAQASCKLRVSLKNQRDSIYERDYRIKLNFNKPQKVNVVRLTPANRGRVTSKTHLIPLDRYVIQNPYNYSLGFTFYGQEYFCSGGAGALSGTSIMRMGIDRILLSGSYEDVSGDFFSQVSFVVPPKESVEITGHFTIPSGAFSGTQVDIIDCQSNLGASSLTLWRDFKRSAVDRTNPQRVVITPDMVKTLPEWKSAN